jgi:[acyl-carrier-protein] S-malonyltransferase
MADPWTEHPAGRTVLDEASESMGRDVVAGCRDDSALETTEFVQPAILACDVAGFRVLQASGLGAPVGVGGHSLGEFAALVAADALTLTEALDLVVARGRAMQRAGQEQPGTMTALIGVGTEEGSAMCDEARDGDVLLVANENSPVQVVASGSVPAIERLETLAEGRKVRAIRLRVAGAFHSPLMEPAVAEIIRRLDDVELRAPSMPIAENVAGELVEDPNELRSLLQRHVVSPVRWESCVRSLAAAGARSFHEAGPGDVLTRLVRRTVPDLSTTAIGTPEDAAALVAQRGA